MKYILFSLLFFSSNILAELNVHTVWWDWFPGFIYIWELTNIDTGEFITDTFNSDTVPYELKCSNYVTTYDPVIAASNNNLDYTGPITVTTEPVYTNFTKITFTIPGPGIWEFRLKIVELGGIDYDLWVSMSSNRYFDNPCRPDEVFFTWVDPANGNNPKPPTNITYNCPEPTKTIIYM